jgi:hypothetical protein
MNEAGDEAWFSGLADELARAVLDAGACAAACEELLEASTALGEPGQQQRLLGALVTPTAICGTFSDLLDRPPRLILGAARICRDTSLAGVEELEALAPPLDWAVAAAALDRVAASCGRLLDAAEMP